MGRFELHGTRCVAAPETHGLPFFHFVVVQVVEHNGNQALQTMFAGKVDVLQRQNSGGESGEAGGMFINSFDGGALVHHHHAIATHHSRQGAEFASVNGSRAPSRATSRRSARSQSSRGSSRGRGSPDTREEPHASYVPHQLAGCCTLSFTVTVSCSKAGGLAAGISNIINSSKLKVLQHGSAKNVVGAYSVHAFASPASAHFVSVSFMSRHRATTTLYPRAVKEVTPRPTVAWSRAISVFAPFKSDTPESIAESFDKDWSLTKVRPLLLRGYGPHIARFTPLFRCRTLSKTSTTLPNASVHWRATTLPSSACSSTTRAALAQIHSRFNGTHSQSSVKRQR